MTKEIGLKDTNETRGHVCDKLLNINAQERDVVTEDMLYVLPTRGQRLRETSLEVINTWSRRPGPLL